MNEHYVLEVTDKSSGHYAQAIACIGHISIILKYAYDVPQAKIDMLCHNAFKDIETTIKDEGWEYKITKENEQVEMDVKIDLASVIAEFEASQKENKKLKKENTELKEENTELKAQVAEEQDKDFYSDYNPRKSGDNFCHMSFTHRKYDLGDDDMPDVSLYGGWEEVKAMLQDDCQAFLLEKVSMTDHSSLSVYPGEPRCPWDSGVIGFAWVTREEIIKEFGDASKASIEKARKLIHAEIAEYNDYLE